MRFRVNLDFDAALSQNDKNFKSDKFLKELEYIFFLVNEDKNSTLCSKNTYSIKYLDHLASYGFILPKIDTNISNYHNWWGELENFSDVKEINSKCSLAGWHRPLDDKVISSIDDFENIFPSFYRPDQSFSGIGNRIIKSKNDLSSLKLPGVQSRYVQVESTFGITYNLKSKEFFVVENLIGKNGEFKGGRLIELSQLSLPFDIEKYICLIKNHIPKRLEEGQIQFDNMIYRSDSKLQLCPIVEINYRRTMGEVVRAVTHKLGNGTLYFGDTSFLNDSSIVLSPPFVKNICYFNRA